MTCKDRLNFATQGGYYSYHRVAAEAAACEAVDITPCKSFAQVLGKCRDETGLGIIAVHNTLSGVVEDSAKELIRVRPSEVPVITHRIDIGVALSLMASMPQTVDQINRPDVKCLGQRPALDQCRGFFAQILPEVELVEAEESTMAIQEMVSSNSPDILAIGPSFAAHALDAFIVGPSQINPTGLDTSFFVLQRDPRQQLLPAPAEDARAVTVLSIAFPDEDGEKDKILNVAENLDLEVVRVIDFASGDYTRDAQLRPRNGGLFDIAVDPYSPLRYRFCKMINHLKANYSGQPGPFSAKPLGGYYWQI